MKIYNKFFHVGQDINFDEFLDKQNFTEINLQKLGEKYQELFPRDLTLPSDNIKNIEDIIEMLHGSVSDTYKESINKFKAITYNNIKE